MHKLLFFDATIHLGGIDRRGLVNEVTQVISTQLSVDIRKLMFTSDDGIFEGTIDIAEGGDYTLLLDVGQTMARRHNLKIDGQTVIEMQNLWLPPTASVIVSLEAGKHTLTAELAKGDAPTVYYNKVENETVFRSPVAKAVDYTVFVGSPDEIIAAIYIAASASIPHRKSWKPPTDSATSKYPST